MRIVISGYYGYHNVGDEAILFSIIQSLKSIEPSIEITVLSNDPGYTEKTYGVNAVNRWDMKVIWNTLKASDGLISGGGSLLQDKTGMRSVPYYTGIMFMAKQLKKPVFIYSQGMGPIDKPISKMITKFALRKTYITVRDEKSKKLLEEIGVRDQIEVVPDPVLGIQLNSNTVPHVDGWDSTKKTVIVSIRDWDTTDPFKEKLVRALDGVVSRGHQVVFIPMHGEHDEATSKEFMELMNQPSLLVKHDLSIEEKINLIASSDLLVGMRLHALIFAAVGNTPFIPISYDPKIDAFAEISGQSIGGDVNTGKWSDSELLQLISQKLHSQTIEEEQLKEKIDPEIKKARDTAMTAIQYIKNSHS